MGPTGYCYRRPLRPASFLFIRNCWTKISLISFVDAEGPHAQNTGNVASRVLRVADDGYQEPESVSPFFRPSVSSTSLFSLSNCRVQTRLSSRATGIDRHRDTHSCGAHINANTRDSSLGAGMSEIL